MSRRGITRERAVRDWLLNDGWFVVRAAGSLGAVDLVALKRNVRARLIEVKSTAQGPYEHFGPNDRAFLAACAEAAGADAYLAWWPPHAQLEWIAEKNWPKR